MATPYLGSKISLISKSEIRYEGVLYTIDTRESTIALAQVRSFGTENRPAEKYVAPREEVFEYIIFRANDIKDLIVDDPPPASITQALGDPAIIQAQSSMPSSGSTYTKPSVSTGAPSSNLNGPSSQITVGSTSAIAPPTSRPVGNLANMPVFTNASAGSQSSVTSGPPAAGPAFGVATTSNMGFRSGGSSPTGGHRRSPNSEAGAQKSQGNRDDKAPKSHLQNNRDPRNQNYRDSYRVGGLIPDRRQGPPPYLRRPMPGQEPPPIVRNMNFRGRGRQVPMGPPPPLPPMMGPPKRGPMMGRAPPQPRPQYNRAPMNRNVRPTTSLKIEDDFDFEKANKEFEELESKLSKVKIEEGEKKETAETGSTTQPQPQPVISEEKSQKEGDEKEEDECVFYDKTKSFFDKISCEALERSKGRVNRIDWRQERKMNAETFGLTANNFRRGGGQRRQVPPAPNSRNQRIFKGNYIDFNQRLRGRNSYGSNSNDRRVNQPQPSW